MQRTPSFFVLTALLVLSLLTPLTGCQMPEAGLGGVMKGGPTVLTVNGQTVTKNEYQKTFEFYSKLMKVGNSPEAAANPVVGEVLKQMTLNQLILTALVEQEAKQQKLTVQPKELDEQIKKQTKLAGGAEALKNLLQEQNMSESDFKQSLQKQLLMNKLIDQAAGPRVAVSDAEAKAYYEAHQQEFTMPYSIRASHLLVKNMVPEIRNELQKSNPKLSGADLQTQIEERMKANEAKAEKLYAAIKAKPESFKSLAKTNSDDKLSAMNEGDLGFLTDRFTDPSFWAAAKNTPVGTLHEGLVKTPFGYHILLVHEKREPYKQSLEESKEAISNVLSQEKRSKFMNEWLSAKQKTVKVVIEPDYQAKSMKDLASKAPANEKAGAKAGTPAKVAEQPAASKASTGG